MKQRLVSLALNYAPYHVEWYEYLFSKFDSTVYIECEENLSNSELPEWEMVFSPDERIIYGKNFVSLFKVICNLKRGDIFLAYNYNRVSLLLLMFISKIKGVKVVFKGEIGFRPGFFKFISKVVFLRLLPVDFFICSTEMSRKLFAALFGKGNVVYLPACVGGEFFYRPITPRDRKFRVCFSGKFIDRKGFRLALKIAKELGQFHSSSIEFHFVGGGSSVQIDAVLELAKNYTNIEFHGLILCQNQLRDLYFDFDVLVLPSVFDPTPKVVEEFLGLGKTVMVSEAVENGRENTADCIIVPDGVGGCFDCESWVRILVELSRSESRVAGLSGLIDCDVYRQSVPLWRALESIDPLASLAGGNRN